MQFSCLTAKVEQLKKSRIFCFTNMKKNRCSRIIIHKMSLQASVLSVDLQFSTYFQLSDANCFFLLLGNTVNYRFFSLVRKKYLFFLFVLRAQV